MNCHHESCGPHFDLNVPAAASTTDWDDRIDGLSWLEWLVVTVQREMQRACMAFEVHRHGPLKQFDWRTLTCDTPPFA